MASEEKSYTAYLLGITRGAQGMQTHTRPSFQSVRTVRAHASWRYRYMHSSTYNEKRMRGSWLAETGFSRDTKQSGEELRESVCLSV